MPGAPSSERRSSSSKRPTAVEPPPQRGSSSKLPQPETARRSSSKKIVEPPLRRRSSSKIATVEQRRSSQAPRMSAWCFEGRRGGRGNAEAAVELQPSPRRGDQEDKVRETSETIAVDKLTAMRFSRGAALAALQASGGDFQRAADSLVKQGRASMVMDRMFGGQRSRSPSPSADEQASGQSSPRSPRTLWSPRNLARARSSVRMRVVRRPKPLQQPPKAVELPGGSPPFRTPRQRMDDAAEELGRSTVRNVLDGLVGSPLPTPMATPRVWPAAGRPWKAKPPPDSIDMVAPMCCKCGEKCLLETRTTHPAENDGYEQLPDLELIDTPWENGGGQALKAVATRRPSVKESDEDAEPPSALAIILAKVTGQRAQPTLGSMAKPNQPTIHEAAREFRPESIIQENLEDIQLPEDAERSMFSRKPHDKLSFMSSAEVTRLEVQTLQQRVKLPRLREMVSAEFALSQGDTETRLRTDKAREDMRKDLGVAAVRAVVMKPHSDRTEMDKDILLDYLKKTDLFEGLGEGLLEELAEELVLRHYNAGETICKERGKLIGAHLILRGQVVMRAGAFAVMLGKASVFGSSQTRGPGYVLGLPELQGKGGVQNPDAWGSSYLWTGTAKSGVQASVETLFLPAEQAQSILEKYKLQNKLEVLAKFPNTQGRSREDLVEKSRVTRHGVKVPLHALFDLLELPRHEVIYKMGDRPPLDQARVMLLASGTVRLKEEGKADAREAILQVGAMFGEEALRGLAYEKTADVTSKLATVLVITAADYCAQFLGGKLKRDLQQPQPAAEQRQGGSKQKRTMALRSAAVQRIMQERQSVGSKQLHQLKDRKLLQQEEWHSLRPKHLLPAVQTARERR